MYAKKTNVLRCVCYKINALAFPCWLDCESPQQWVLSYSSPRLSKGSVPLDGTVLVSHSLHDIQTCITNATPTFLNYQNRIRLIGERSLLHMHSQRLCFQCVTCSSSCLTCASTVSHLQEPWLPSKGLLWQPHCTTVWKPCLPPSLDRRRPNQCSPSQRSRSTTGRGSCSVSRLAEAVQWCTDNALVITLVQYHFNLLYTITIRSTQWTCSCYDVHQY